MINDNSQDALKKDLTRLEVMADLEAQINQTLYDLENDYLPQLGHSQVKRLLVAAMSYPAKEKEFSVAQDGEALVKAFSLCKGLSDTLVAMGVEIVIGTMVEKAVGEQTTKEKENE